MKEKKISPCHGYGVLSEAVASIPMTVSFSYPMEEHWLTEDGLLVAHHEREKNQTCHGYGVLSEAVASVLTEAAVFMTRHNF